MFVTAVRHREELFVYPPRWTFSEFRWDNFADMWVKTNFGGALLNSLYGIVASDGAGLVLSIPAAYRLVAVPLSRQGRLSQLPADDADDVADRPGPRAVPADGGSSAW